MTKLNPLFSGEETPPPKKKAKAPRKKKTEEGTPTKKQKRRTSIQKALDTNIEKLMKKGWSEENIQRYIRGWNSIDAIREAEAKKKKA